MTKVTNTKTKKPSKVSKKSITQYTPKTGRGFVNSLIDRLPFEMHLPGYQYCGPGTKLSKRLQRGDPGINELDKACKEHDITYNFSPRDHDRELADQILLEKATKRIKSKSASVGEKLAAATVAGIMNTKSKFGAGFKKTPKCTHKKKKSC